MKSNELHGQMTLHVPDDWCTYKWAADYLGVSIRTVVRYVESGLLASFMPRMGRGESRRNKRMLNVAQIKAMRDARQVIGRG